MMPPRPRAWDFALTVATVALLVSLGVQSFLGTLWVWFSETTISGWENGAGYQSFVTWMNALAAPQLVALVVVMGLCVPKRLFDRRTLVVVSAAMVAAGLLAGALRGSLATGLAVYLCVASLIQIAVVVAAAVGHEHVGSLARNRIAKVGSGLTHLGFIAFALLVTAFQESPFVMQAFVVATALTMGGGVLVFYAEPISRVSGLADERRDEVGCDLEVGGVDHGSDV